jgi:hypothetical protein
MEQTTTMNRIPAPRAYNAMTLRDIRDELAATFAAILNREIEDFFTSPETIDDFQPLMAAAAAIIDLEHALHECRYGDSGFDPEGKPEGEM